MDLIQTNDVAGLIAPVHVSVPETIDDACVVLDGVGGVMSAGHWGTAAIVWAYTYPESEHGGDRRSEDFKVKSDLERLSMAEFTSKGIRGLSSINSVRKYRGAWDHAIEQGWAEPVSAGATAILPSEDFKTEIGAHVGHNSGEIEWYTPATFVAAARQVMGGVDLDPASCEAANRIVGATRFFSAADDGLSQKWEGRVWMNPPYSGGRVGPFCRKLLESFQAGDVSQACVLVNNATETTWWQELCEAASLVCFTEGRISFWHPGRDSKTPLQGQTVLYFGNNGERFVDEFSQLGSIAMIWHGAEPV